MLATLSANIAVLLLSSSLPASGIVIGKSVDSTSPSDASTKLDEWLKDGRKFVKINDGQIVNTRQISTTAVSACSRKGLKGFQFTHEGHFDHSFKHGTMNNITACADKCWTNSGCNGFSYETVDPKRCYTYNGLLPTFNFAARSYRKCGSFEAKLEICMNSEIQGYKFSHQGWWPNAIRMKSTATPEECSKRCSGNKDCTAFTWIKPRGDHHDMADCMTYVGRHPIKSPGSVSYSRCFVRRGKDFLD